MLHKLQQDFKNGVLNSDDTILNLIQKTGGVHPNSRLGIYQNNTMVSLKECLLSTYEGVAQLVSVEFFRYMADVYIRSHPPTSGCLLHYGRDFSDFIEDFEPVQEHPYLPDLARLEWFMQESANAKDDIALNPREIANLGIGSFEKLILKLRASVRLISSQYAIYSLWQTLKNDSVDFQGFDINQPEGVLLVRPGWDVFLFKLSPGEMAFLSAIQKGKDFSNAAQCALAQEKGLDLQKMLEKFLENVIFQEIHLNSAVR